MCSKENKLQLRLTVEEIAQKTDEIIARYNRPKFPRIFPSSSLAWTRRHALTRALESPAYPMTHRGFQSLHFFMASTSPANRAATGNGP